jgi:hypothetical protein
MDKLSTYNYDTLLELYCVAWYTKFKRFPVRQSRLPDKETLIRRIDLLRRHR